MMPTNHHALTLVETLVAIAVVTLLAILALPAVQSAREAMRRNACQHNLRQVGVALGEVHDALRQFPPGRDARLGRDHSWATAILPQLEQAELFDRYDYQRKWDDDSSGSQNHVVAQTTLAIYQCPSTPHDVPAESDYGGNYGTTLTGLEWGFGKDKGWDAGVLISSGVFGTGQVARVRLADIRDGAAHTLAVVENAGYQGSAAQWANGNRCVAHDHGPINSDRSLEIFSDHPGGAHVLLADGAVRFLSEQTSLPNLGALCTRSGDEMIDAREAFD